MENKEQQLKELRDKINESLNKLNELEANYKREKPVIEVGKVYKEGGWLLFIKEKCYNFEKEGWCKVYGFHFEGNWINDERVIDGDGWIEATKEEWETALTKYCNKLYEGVEKVDRKGLDCRWISGEITNLNPLGNNGLDEEGFFYKGQYVIDKHGNIAKPVKEDWDIYVSMDGNVKWSGNKEYEHGKYKLVKVN